MEARILGHHIWPNHGSHMKILQIDKIVAKALDQKTCIYVHGGT